MRILHLVGLVFGAAIVFSLLREPAGRVAVVVFFCGLAEVFVGLAGVMTLFQTIGALGEARQIHDHVRAVGETVLVSTLSALLMLAIFALGLVLIGWVVPPV